MKMSRKPLPQRKKKRKQKKLSAFPEKCRNDLVSSSKEGSVRQLMVTYAEVPELLIRRQRAKRVNHEKKPNTVSKNKALEMCFIAKTREITEDNRWLLRKQQIGTKMYPVLT